MLALVCMKAWAWVWDCKTALELHKREPVLHMKVLVLQEQLQGFHKYLGSLEVGTSLFQLSDLQLQNKKNNEVTSLSFNFLFSVN